MTPADAITQRYAAYPWYAVGDSRAAVDALWAGLRTAFAAAGVAHVPVQLDRRRAYGVDPDGECLFTQTCSYTLFTTATDAFTVLATPGYAAPGCDDTLHRSFIVVRDTAYVETLEDLRGKTFAVNEKNSNSGMNLPRAMFSHLHREGAFFGNVVVSGSHVGSADLVSRGRADPAAIDCVTFALLQRFAPPAVRRLRIIAETQATHTPPFVTSSRTTPAEVEMLRNGLVAFFTDPATRAVREALLLAGIDLLGKNDYRDIMRIEREAAQRGYPELR